jgi:ribosomal protein S18 acetylase RimI-like enzyme
MPMLEYVRPLELRIERVVDADAVLAAADLFDARPRPDATAGFLARDGHHLLLAHDHAGRAVGMVSGIETAHPDKGTEMLLYELGVAQDARRRGIGTALVRALADLARERGCTGMWVAVDAGNDPALATYRAAGAGPPEPCAVLAWDLRARPV